jgi:hypothetical protein
MRESMNSVNERLIKALKAEIRAKDKYIACLLDLVQCLKNEKDAYKTLLGMKENKNG